MKVKFLNTPSENAVRGAWEVIANALSEKHGVPIKVVSGDEAVKLAEQCQMLEKKVINS